MSVAVVLHNIRSSHNVGAIFRTADAAGVRELFLVGYTPTPISTFGQINKEIQKTALGAELTVPWKHIRTWRQCKEELSKKKYTIVAVEQHKNAIPYKTLARHKHTAYIFGNEVRGFSAAVLQQADAVIELPMSGLKESLNVAVTAGIILYARL